MEGLKRLSQVSRERGLSTKLLRKAIAWGHLKSYRPGIGAHTWHFTTDADVDRWLASKIGGRS